MAAAANGDAMAAFVGQDGYVYAMGYDSASTGWTTYQLDPGSTPALSMDSQGNAILLWVVPALPLVPDGVYGKKFLPGSGWGPSEIIAGGGTSPHISMNAFGDATAVWAEADGIHAKRYVAGSGWTGAQVISSAGASAPRVGVDVAGNATAVWSQSGSIYRNRYSIFTGWGAEELLAAAAVNGCCANVAVNETGAAVAVWVQNDDVVQNAWASVYE
jgi:hypothetical protein